MNAASRDPRGEIREDFGSSSDEMLAPFATMEEEIGPHAWESFSFFFIFRQAQRREKD